MNKAVITTLNHHIFLWIYEDDLLVECHPLNMNPTLQVGDIYIGRIEKVVKNIQAAFVKLDKEQVGYLPLDKGSCRVLNRTLPKGLISIAENDTVLVQIEQEPLKLKQARVTGNISLNGKYVAIDCDGFHSGISKKIKDKKKCEHLLTLLPQHPKFGYVFRTACENAADSDILEEVDRLTTQLEDILSKADYQKNTGCLVKGKEEYLNILSSYGFERFDVIKTDIPEIYDNLVAQKITQAVLYQEEYPLYKLLGLETEWKHITSKKVWLKSGGFLVIEPTEAMVVIDVNTGKSIGKKDREKHTFKINREAAIEVARQIRLRNLSGIIMVDFINMDQEENKKALSAVLSKQLAKDKTTSRLIDVTKLELYEITRKKIRKPIHEIMQQFEQKQEK